MKIEGQMDIRIEGESNVVTDGLRAHAEKSLGQALGRFGERIRAQAYSGSRCGRGLNELTTAKFGLHS